MTSSPLSGSGKERLTTPVKVKKTVSTGGTTAQEAKRTADTKKSVDSVNSIINAIERMLCIDKQVSGTVNLRMCDYILLAGEGFPGWQ